MTIQPMLAFPVPAKRGGFLSTTSLRLRDRAEGHEGVVSLISLFT